MSSCSSRGIRPGLLVPLAALLLVALTGACAPRLAPLGPTTAAPQLTDAALTAFDGQALAVTITPAAPGPPRAIVLALHGFNDYANAFAEPAQDWAARGITTVALDQRGFGRNPRRGIWPGWTTLRADAMALAQAARARWPGLPIVLVGESMGGSAALLAASGPDPAPVDRVVLLAPAVWGRETMNGAERAALWVMAHTLPWLEVTPQNLNIRPSDNLEMLRALGRDPLVIKRTRIDAIHGLVDLMDEARRAAPALVRPTLVFWGQSEALIPQAARASFDARLPPDLARIVAVESGWHMLLRDLGAAPTRAAVADFVLSGPAANTP